MLENAAGWRDDTAASAATASGDDDILLLEPEALAVADSDGPEAALAWLQNRPGITSVRSRWLLRLLMARIAEQTGNWARMLPEFRWHNGRQVCCSKSKPATSGCYA